MKRRGRPPYPEILTPRQSQVLALLRDGLTDQQIAEHLGISLAGAKYHVSEILSRLGVHTREQAAHWPDGQRRAWQAFALPIAAWKATAMLFILAIVAGLGLLAWGVWATGGGPGEVAVAKPSPSGSPVPLATPSPAPTVSPPPVPTPSAGRPAGAEWIAFITPPVIGSSYGVYAGQIWISSIDGSDARPLTPEGTQATFAGIAGPHVYYVAFEGQHDRVLRRFDLDSGEDVSVFGFEAIDEWRGSADVSPDGRYAAIVVRDSVELLDLETGESTRLVSGNRDVCTASDCRFYRRVAWSPDSNMILAGLAYFEGGTGVLVTPHSDPHEIKEFLEMSGPHIQGWSPSGGDLCMAGQYASSSSLYVASGPGWGAAQFFPELEQPGAEGESVLGCAWLSNQEIALLLRNPYDPTKDQFDSRLDILDRVTGTVRSAASLDTMPVPYTMVGTPGSPSVLFNFHPDWYRTGQALQPLLLNIATGESQHVLNPGDWVVAIVPAPPD